MPGALCGRGTPLLGIGRLELRGCGLWESREAVLGRLEGSSVGTGIALWVPVK